MASPDSLHATALEHLRVIRTLMERANIYRAVSAPAALIGGVLSLGLAAYQWKPIPILVGGYAVDDTGHHARFLAGWLAVLVVTGVLNLVLLSKETGRKGEPVITDGLRMALRALVPPMLTGGILGSCLMALGHSPTLGAIVWILCYGLALQATVSFAPRSIILLARSFLITGQALVLFFFLKDQTGFREQNTSDAALVLGFTFGLYHVIYAIAVFVSKPNTAETDAARSIETP
jgi:hypothetical protein